MSAIGYEQVRPSGAANEAFLTASEDMINYTVGVEQAV
jgi:hypothetical protein